MTSRCTPHSVTCQLVSEGAIEKALEAVDADKSIVGMLSVAHR